MAQPLSRSTLEQVVTAVIELTRLSDLRRTIVGDGDNLAGYLAPRQRGFGHVAMFGGGARRRNRCRSYHLDLDLSHSTGH
jgi:hypothetical protein